MVQLGTLSPFVDLGGAVDVVVVGDEGTDFFGGANSCCPNWLHEAEDTDPVVVMMKRTQTCVLRRGPRRRRR